MFLNQTNYVDSVNRCSGKSSANFTDFLLSRHESKNSDLWWAIFHKFSSAQYEQSQGRTPKQIWQDVYGDPLIQSLIEKDSSAKKKIDEILKEMRHTFSLNYSRIVYYFVLKIMKSTCQKFFVENRLGAENEDLVASLNLLAKNSRIVYLPSHRSYADFLIFSLINFWLNIPIPTVAAGANFLGMKWIVYLLRCCGAFFIRRSFKGDRSYWNIFHSYVTSQIIGAEHPLKFYIEGARSRTGKSYYPRIGLVRIAVEHLLRGHIPDLVFVPVMINYERILEEELYAKELNPELENFRKPNENITNLIYGIMKIFFKNYGSMYMRFCRPISIRKLIISYPKGENFLEKHINDSSNTKFEFSNEENEFVLDVAKSVLIIQNENLVLSSFSFACVILLSQYSWFNNPTEPSVPKSNIVYPVSLLLEDLSSLAFLVSSNLNINITGETIEVELKRALQIHSNLVYFDAKMQTITVNYNDLLKIIQLQMYANQSMQLLIDFAIYLYARGDSKNFKKIRTILEQEFICRTTQLDTMFNKAKIALTNEENSIFDFKSVRLTENAYYSLVTQVFFYLNSYYKITDWFICQINISKASSEQQLKFSINFCRKCLKKQLKLPNNIIENAFTLLTMSKCVIEMNSLEGTFKMDQDKLIDFDQKLLALINIANLDELL